MKAQKLRPKKAIVESEDVAAKSSLDYKKQKPLRVAPPTNAGVGEELLVDYVMKYSLEYCGTKSLRERFTRRVKNSGCTKAGLALKK